MEKVIEKIICESKTIAVVGISNKPERPSHRVAAYLQSQGYRIIPVNPRLEEVLGERCYTQVAVHDWRDGKVIKEKLYCGNK